MSLLSLIRIGNQSFLNELFKELCTSMDIFGRLYGNVFGFVKLIVTPDFSGVEVTGTKLSTTTGVDSSLLMNVKYTSDSRIFIWRKESKECMPCW